ncbi:MAG: mechanosensitive ion channel domain-containing protein [bacterium]
MQYNKIMEIMKNILDHDAFFSLVMILIACFASVIIYLVIAFLLTRMHKKTIFNRLEISPVRLKAPLRSLVPAGCLLFITPVLRFTGDLWGFVTSIVSIWFIASISWLLISIVHTLRESFLSLYDIKSPDNRKARSIYTQVKVIENIVIILIVFLTIVFILMSFEEVRQIGTGLLASAGILGMILGFAAQKTLTNLIAGIQIAFAQPIRLDDVVIVENEWGWIEDITLTYVVVRVWDLRRLVIPISYFIEKPFQNWTRVSADILGSVFLYADYTVPVDKIRAELTHILENSPRWDKKVNVLQVTEAKEQTVEIRALMSAADSSTAWDLRCEVREKLLTFLQKNFPESLPKTRIELNKETLK